MSRCCSTQRPCSPSWLSVMLNTESFQYHWSIQDAGKRHGSSAGDGQRASVNRGHHCAAQAVKYDLPDMSCLHLM